jgi:hypothetical protein
MFHYLQKDSKVFIYSRDFSLNKKYINIFDENNNLIRTLDGEMIQSLGQMLWSLETNELVIYDNNKEFWVIDQDTGKKLRPFVIKNKIS